MVVLNGMCGGVIDADGYSASEIYLRDSSVLHLKATGNSVVHISVYDNAILDIQCSDAAKVFIYQYGGTVNKSGNRKVVVRDRKII